MSALRSSALARVRPGELSIPREAVLLCLLIVEIIVLSQVSPYFLTVTDLLGGAQFFVETGLMALGMTMVIVTGGIDLSVGGGLALASVTLGFSYQSGVPLALAIIAAVAVATVGGVLNGVLITRWNVHPLVITLATGQLFRGIAEAVSNENAVSTFPGWFNAFGQNHVGPVPNQLIVFVIVAAGVWVVLERGRFGRGVFAVGINDQTARFSGLPSQRTKVAVYAITGLLVGIAAVIYTSRVSTARSDADIGIEISVIGAVVLGGASITGGSGSVLGTILGVLILAFLQQGLLLITTLDSNWILVATGAVMVSGVFVNEFFRRRE
jgi:rhamnose transport system permease protein